MPNSLGEENKETQGVADNRNMSTDHREKTTKRPDQPNSRPRREAGTASTFLEQEPRSETKRKKRQRNFIEELTQEAETAADHRNIKRLYEITRILSGRKSKTRTAVPFQGRKTREQDGQNTSRKHSTDLHHPFR